MKVVKSQLKSGLRVLTVPMPSLESATVTVWVGTGSRSETDNISGISHFLEHMAFKGGRKYKTARAVSEAIDSIGGDFNAGTSKHWTNFYVRSSVQHLEKCFDVLSDMLLSPSLKQSDINREKGVIIEEMNMYEDTPTYKIGDLFENLIFEKTNLGRDIIGTKETVNSLTKKDFVDYRNKFYTADNMLITVSGGVETSDVLKLAEKYFGGLNSKLNSEIEKYEVTQEKPRLLLRNKVVDQVHMILGFIGNPLDHADKYAEGLLATIIGGGMSSRLFTEVREKRGLAYSIQAGTDHYIDTGVFYCHAGLDRERVDEAIKVILKEFQKIAGHRSQITNDELRKAKGYMKGHFALSLESTKSTNYFFGFEELMLGKTRTPEEVLEGIEKVTASDVERVAKKLFVKKNLNLAIIGPFKDEGRFRKLIS